MTGHRLRQPLREKYAPSPHFLCDSFLRQRCLCAVGSQTFRYNTCCADCSAQLDVSAIDKSADPCTDFYAYACGNWRKANPIPADQARWGRFNELGERDRYLLYVDLKKAADNPTTELQRKYGNFYAACMNIDLADQLGEKPVEAALAKSTLANKQNLAALVADLSVNDGTHAFLQVWVRWNYEADATQQIGALYPGRPLAAGPRILHLERARMTTIREQYKQYVTALFKLAGDDVAKAAGETDAVLTIETALALGSMPRVDLRDPKKVITCSGFGPDDNGS